MYWLCCRAGDKKELFSDLTGFPVLQEHHQQIQEVLTDILDHLREVRLTLKTPSLDYTSVSGHEVPTYLCVCVYV